VLALMDSRRPFAAQRRMSSMIFPRSYETVSGSFSESMGHPVGRMM